ncbi:MAG: outer membrane lipoprotein-sorting protein [Spirochaetales bacterium]
MLKFIFRISLAAVALACLLPAAAQDLSGAELMAKYFHRTKPKTEITTMVMTITKNGASLTRTMMNWGTGDNAKGEVERRVVKFLAPGDIKGSGFLTSKKVDGSTESQLWLPALGKVRRLGSGASDQDSAFFGSDFTNRDISGFVEADFTYTLLSTANNTATIEAKPKKEMGYERLVYSLDLGDFAARKIEYYKAGKLAKAQVLTLEKVGAYLLPSLIVMTSTSGSKTELKVSDQKVDQDVSDATFTERFLKQ